MRRSEHVAERDLGLATSDPLRLLHTCRNIGGVLGWVNLTSLEALADADEL